MSQIQIYFDEDAMDSDLVAALRSRGVTVITPLDVLLTGRSDEQLYPDPLLLSLIHI